LSWDDVELGGVDERVDRCLLGSDSSPVGVDVAGEAPTVVSRPDEGGWEVSHAVEGFLPAAQVGQLSVEEEIPPMRDGHHRPMQHRGREVEVAIALPDAEIAALGCGGEAPQVLEG
jgi:hypothetical protein